MTAADKPAPTNDEMMTASVLPASALANSCRALGCEPSDLVNVRKLDKGHTNVSYIFDVRADAPGAGSYIYRHPGNGTSAIISRQREAYVQTKADELGLDGTTVAIDPQEGWKLSHFIPGAIDFDYRNPDHVAQGLALLRRLHDAALPCPFSSDMKASNRELARLIEEQGIADSHGLVAYAEPVRLVQEGADRDGVASVLCHNDACDANFLVTPGEMRLIDWEYGGLADPGSDLASFICGTRFAPDEVDALIAAYFGHQPSVAEHRHMIGYIALYCYHWLLWAEYQEAHGMVGNQMPAIWEEYAQAYIPRAAELYRER